MFNVFCITLKCVLCMESGLYGVYRHLHSMLDMQIFTNITLILIFGIER